ncbi:amidohydrolase family protein [Rhodopila sp.]|jgi:predicted TIM-barrel fold metal-dependent hydrolase|uniref:amidohydrolase family protein n=1 Tax=Rhodopila sp. TaxID=2480087 RepID=UPI002B8D3D7B|nr:amidohydrolase family protein [Rhodopila sp.]HVZ08217.1 amidohydrolase family protein [Rhodopila sp.]
MNAPVSVAARDASSLLGLIDCDIHPYPKAGALNRYLSERWRNHVFQYGKFNCGPYADRGSYPRFSPNTSRRDSWPPNGGLPGSDVDFIRTQLLDPYNIEYGVLEPLLGGNTSRNLDEAAALCAAMNDWQAHDFVDVDRRLRASILVPQDDPEASVKEIEKRAGDWRFCQVQLGSKTSEPLGRRRYWPIFAAAQANGLSIGLHIGGTQANAPSASGWPQYYIEDHQVLSHSMQNQAASLILEGVFDAFPNLKIVLIEGGFAWVPQLAWRLDAHWMKMRDEAPLKQKPSDYMKTNLWFATQPVEEPERPDDLRQVFEWIGWDRMVYSSDYPHWDFDDPHLAFRFQMTERERRMLFHDNALAVYTFR